MPVDRRGLVIVAVCTGAGPENSDGRLGALDVDATGAGGAADEKSELVIGCCRGFGDGRRDDDGGCGLMRPESALTRGERGDDGPGSDDSSSTVATIERTPDAIGRVSVLGIGGGEPRAAGGERIRAGLLATAGLCGGLANARATSAASSSDAKDDRSLPSLPSSAVSDEGGTTGVFATGHGGVAGRGAGSATSGAGAGSRTGVGAGSTVGVGARDDCFAARLAPKPDDAAFNGGGERATAIREAGGGDRASRNGAAAVDGPGVGSRDGAAFGACRATGDARAGSFSTLEECDVGGSAAGAVTGAGARTSGSIFGRDGPASGAGLASAARPPREGVLISAPNESLCVGSAWDGPIVAVAPDSETARKAVSRQQKRLTHFRALLASWAA